MYCVQKQLCPIVLCASEPLPPSSSSISAPLMERLKAFGIEHRTAPVRAPHCNPVERTNRTIKTMIAQYVDQDHRNWDEHLFALQFAYNTAVHDATGYTPAYLNHGRELTPPTPLPDPTEREDGEEVQPDEIRRRLEDAYGLAKIHLARAFQRQQHYYDLRRRGWQPAVGEWVWKRDHPLSKKNEAFNAKLAPRYVGPLEVRRKISPVIVDLRSEKGKWYRHVHIQELKPAPENKNNNRPEDEPLHENQDDDEKEDAGDDENIDGTEDESDED